MMKKGFSALLICTLLVSCTRSLDIEQDQTYTLTVVADKGADTRTLGLDGSGALKATWTEGETVTVYKTSNMDVLGTLTAQTSGQSTTLSGTITGDIKVGTKISLDFLSSDYTNQDGTLTGNSTSIDKVCDYATATVRITAIDGSTVTTGPATFTNMQAIVWFTMKHNNNIVDVEEMSLTVGYLHSSTPSSITISVTPPTPTKDLYVAIPCYYEDEFSFSMQVQTFPFSYIYNKDIASINLENGKFYHLTVTLPQ